MQVYLVGGAVRNQLLQLPVVERDWVVIGSDESAMLSLGYQRVGKTFPVFLHPETREEYALARREVKTGVGYKGFACEIGDNITLEEDLKRRDLTINAIARDEFGQLIDPFNGQKDIEDRVLRHVSTAFAEDPLRVLRVARFAAVLTDFTVHPETLALMKDIVASGELNHLIAERVWMEIAKALLADAPQRFFSVLRECGALAVLFPEFSDNKALEYYLQKAAQVTDLEYDHKLAVLWSVCCCEVPVATVKAMVTRVRAPKECMRLAVLVAKYVQAVSAVADQPPEALVEMLDALDAWRRGRRLQCFFMVCHIIYGENYPGLLRLRSAYVVARRITAEEVLVQGVSGPAVGNALYKARVAAVKALR